MEASDENNVWICGKCKAALTSEKAIFRYLGSRITHEVSRCPVCGKVFIPKTLAEGKMAEVEAQLEDK